jgi:hypothetical protein
MTRGDTLVTVCINNHNYGAFVGAAVDSCLAQSHPRVEVVVVDDGSTDDSRQVLEGYGTRIRTIFQDNAGQSAAVNAGFAVARGDLVILLDADDLLLPTRSHGPWPPSRPTTAGARAVAPRAGGRAGTAHRTHHPAAGVATAHGDLSDVALRYRTYVWNPTSASAYRRSALDQVLPMPEHTYERQHRAGPLPLRDGGAARTGRRAGRRRRAVPIHRSNYTTTSRPRRRRLPADEGGGDRRRPAARARAGPASGSGGADDPRVAKDWAFAAYRLALLRVDPSGRLPGDTVPRLVLHGVRSVVSHPHLSAGQRAKRAAWFFGMGLAPHRAVSSLIGRLLHSSPERRVAAEQSSE